MSDSADRRAPSPNPDPARSATADVVWLDGRILPRDEARIASDDRGLLLADGLFETMLARGGRIVRLPRHANRLAGGARTLRLPTPPDGAAITAAARELLAARGLDGADMEAGVRLTFTRGSGQRGLDSGRSIGPATGRRSHRPTVLLTAVPLAQPFNFHPSARAVRSRYPVAVSPLSRFKTLSYASAVAARAEARSRGADLALRPNSAGRLAGADAASLLVLQGTELVTPPFSEGALAGTVRAALLSLAAGIGLVPRVAPLAYSTLIEADAVLVSSSLMGLREVSAIDDRRVGRRAPEIVARLDRLRDALASDDCDCDVE